MRRVVSCYPAAVFSASGSWSMGLFTGGLDYILPFLVDPHRAGVRARARPLPRRALQRRARRGVLDRLRSGALRLERSGRNALEIQRGAARRLRQDVRRCRCGIDAGCRHRAHERGGARGLLPLTSACRSARRSWRRARSPISSSRWCCWPASLLPSANPSRRPEVGQVEPGSAAEQRRHQGGRRHPLDRRRADQPLRGRAARRAASIPARPMHMVVRRGGGQVTIAVTPRVTRFTDRFGNEHKIGLLGIERSGVNYVRRNPAERRLARGAGDSGTSPPARCRRCGRWPSACVRPMSSAARCASRRCRARWRRAASSRCLWFLAVLSINLGLINLFPIPVLDGGHLLFYVAEAIRGRPLGPACAGIWVPSRPRSRADAHGIRHLERPRALAGRRVHQGSHDLKPGASAKKRVRA